MPPNMHVTTFLSQEVALLRQFEFTWNFIPSSEHRKCHTQWIFPMYMAFQFIFKILL